MQTHQNHSFLKQMFQILFLVLCYFSMWVMNNYIMLDSIKSS
jgi:hypothetical protein